ncbi:MAG: STAS/SEC14 domain-containing protein [Mangrovicoccus sp.]|nr:STAS/SEC14 domain-containing protein [Mangrovicoccus sp.]
MSVQMTREAAKALVTLEVDGKVTREDFDRIAPEFEAFVEEQGQIRLIEVIRNLEGFEPGLIWDGLKLDLRVIPHITHCAVVSDIGWMSPLAKAASAVISTQLRSFALADLETAQAWIMDPAP